MRVLWKINTIFIYNKDTGIAIEKKTDIQIIYQIHYLWQCPFRFTIFFGLFFIWELFCNEISDKIFKIFIMTEKYFSHELCISKFLEPVYSKFLVRKYYLLERCLRCWAETLAVLSLKVISKQFFFHFIRGRFLNYSLNNIAIYSSDN